MARILCALLCILAAVRADEDMGCGGFVRASGGLGGAKPDLSPVKAILYTSGGVVKAETECAPNGYYYLPMYDAGTYTLKLEGPPGWLFAPEEIEVSSAATGPCASGKDIDFEIVGFALAGRVLTDGADTGPAGVQMTLKSSSGATYSAQTVAGGAFLFKDAPQGTYTITANHPKWKFKTSSSAVVASFGESAIKETFGVLGFDVSGRVNWATGAPGVSVTVLLKHKSGGKDLKATTDAVGLYVFDSVAPGEYVVVVDGKNFEVEPAKGAAVSVAHGTAAVSETLKITSFSIKGKVIDAAGEAVAGVEVMVDGKKAATTDASGSYTLKTAAGTYTISANKEHMEFGALSKYEISSQLRRIGSISADKYSLCGQVVLDSASASGLTVTVKPAKGGKAQTTKTDAKGKFCLMLPVGDYTASVSGSSAVITPAALEVSVLKGPVLDARFGQVALHVRGKVVCLDSPCSGIQVVLEQNGKVLKKTSDSIFAFDDVTAGTYTVKVSRTGWCWQRDSVTVRVGQEDSSSIKMVQSGFEKTVMSASAGSISIKHESGSTHVLKIASAQKMVCLPKSGAFALEPQQCQTLATTQFTTASAEALDLAPSKQAVLIKMTGASGDLSVDILVGGTKSTLEARLDGGSAVATYWGAVGEELDITPRCSDASVIFQPTSNKMRVSSTVVCPAAAVTFASKKGQTLSGKVVPAMEGVVVIAEEEGGAEAGRAVTREDGTYAIGPLDDKKYQLRAAKNNFQFKKEGSDFRSVRMGEVKLEAVDESGNILAGVMLSMSGEGGFRHNNKTGDDGSYTFSGMVPGDYFVRPMLKEFQFSPASQSLVIQQGTNPTVGVKAKRVAFSAFGSVTLLDGNPEKNCVMQALALDGSGSVEEGTSDIEGTFRIRGLKAGVKYAISVKSGVDAPRHERGTPSAAEITMTNGDYQKGDLSFMAFRKLKTLDLVGTVETGDMAHLHSVTVELMSGSNSGVVLQTMPLTAANYFEFPALSRGDYIVRATSSLDTRAYKISSATVKVKLEDMYEPVEMVLKAEPRNGGDSVSNTNFIFLVLLVVGGYIFANRRELFAPAPIKIDAVTASNYEGNAPPPLSQAKKPVKGKVN